MTQKKYNFKSLNQVTVCGRLGADPVLTYIKSGTALLKLSIALSRGDENETTDWVRVNVWGKRAEYLANVAKKGSEILVTGSVQTNTWEDKDGKKNYSTEILADRTMVIQRAEKQPTDESTFSKFANNTMTENDLPF